MPSSKSAQRADMTMDEDEFDIRSTRCPKCGKTLWGTGDSRYCVGGYTTRYFCNGQSFGGKWCNGTVDVKSDDQSIVWASTNGKWHINDPSVASPGDEFYRRIVQASYDGYSYCTIQRYSDGSIRSDWELPKYVMDAARKILERKSDTVSRSESPKCRSPKSSRACGKRRSRCSVTRVRKGR